jgi:hypothetical protein
MERVPEAKRLREQGRGDPERLGQSVRIETFPRYGADMHRSLSCVRLGEVARREATLVGPSDCPSRRLRCVGMEHITAVQMSGGVDPGQSLSGEL